MIYSSKKCVQNIILYSIRHCVCGSYLNCLSLSQSVYGKAIDGNILKIMSVHETTQNESFVVCDDLLFPRNLIFKTQY